MSIDFPAHPRDIAGSRLEQHRHEVNQIDSGGSVAPGRPLVL